MTANLLWKMHPKTKGGSCLNFASEAPNSLVTAAVSPLLDWKHY